MCGVARWGHLKLIGIIMGSLLAIIVSFVLTGLIGNRLAQAWQARNWLLQQRFLGQEKEYVELKELADEIASLLGVRIYLCTV